MSNQRLHLCRNPKCPYGKDGAPKQYYACRDCDKVYSWKAVACCRECYTELAMLGLKNVEPIILSD